MIKKSSCIGVGTLCVRKKRMPSAPSRSRFILIISIFDVLVKR